MSYLVNDPAHYTQHASSIECIEITEGMTWSNLANAFKYLWRLGLKGSGLDDEIRGLGKAIFYVRRTIRQFRLIDDTNEAKRVVENKRYSQAVKRFLEYEGDPVFAMLLESDSTQDGHIGLLSNVLMILSDRLDDLQAKNPWQTVDRWIEHNRGLVDAIVRVESAGEEDATRYEKDYQYLWLVNSEKPVKILNGSFFDFESFYHTTGDTEFIGQKHSWGPMQVMGAVAREYGFTGRFPALCELLGVRYGALHLMRLKERLAKRGMDSRDDLIAAYNAGWVYRDKQGDYVNIAYVEKVNSAMDDIA